VKWLTASDRRWWTRPLSLNVSARYGAATGGDGLEVSELDFF
jgi:hypothetical protein